MNSLHAAWYADRAVRRVVRIERNTPVADRTYRLGFACPEMARPSLPGQFLMLRLAGCHDPLLGRPMALYDTVPGPDGQARGIEVVYWVEGKFTRSLSRVQPGQELIVWGPLGNGFCLSRTEHLIMVAGGIGQTPFLTLAQECLGRQHLRPSAASSGGVLARHALLRYTHGGVSGRTGGFSAGGRGGAHRDRRWQPGSPWVGHGDFGAGLGRRGRGLSNRLLRTAVDDAGGGPDGSAAGARLPGVARDAHGLWRGDLFHVRGPHRRW